MKNLFPKVAIKNLHILIDADKLQVICCNQEILQYEDLELKVLLDNDNTANEILVPFLITQDRLHYPILDTYAIIHISQNYQSNELASVLNKYLPGKESHEKFIHAEKL